MVVLTIQLEPLLYLENSETSVADVQEEEWEAVCEMYQKIVRYYRQSYPEVEVLDMKNENPYLLFSFKKASLSEEEMVELLQIFCGYSSDNEIFLDDQRYTLKSELIDYDKKEEEISFLQKYNETVKSLEEL